MSPEFEYEQIRNEIKAEHTLIANRLTWYVTSQSFLVTAFAISRGAGFTWHHWFSALLVPIVAFTISGLIFPSILGARITLHLWHRKQQQFFDSHPDIKTAFHLRRAPWIERRGLLFPVLMPVIFGGFWLVVLVGSLFK